MEKAAQILDGSAGTRVLVVGDCMLDHYVTGEVDRISPEAPVPVVRVRDERRALGGAGNVAAGVVSLGAGCGLVAVVGDDRTARQTRDLLAESGIDDGGLVVDRGRPTTLKSRVLARHQQMLRIDRESDGSLDRRLRDALFERGRERLDEADVVVLVDYDKGVLDDGVGGRLLEEARERGVPTVVDPKLRSFFDYGGAHVFKPNDKELAAALGSERPPRTPEALERVRERLRCEHLLVTRGGEGMTLVSRGREGRVSIPSEAREVFDVSGAGDTVTAVLAASLAGGAGVADAAALANYAAGLEVSHLGAVPIGRDELLEALGRDDEVGDDAPGVAPPEAPRSEDPPPPTGGGQER